MDNSGTHSPHRHNQPILTPETLQLHQTSNDSSVAISTAAPQGDSTTGSSSSIKQAPVRITRATHRQQDYSSVDSAIANANIGQQSFTREVQTTSLRRSARLSHTELPSISGDKEESCEECRELNARRYKPTAFTSSLPPESAAVDRKGKRTAITPHRDGDEFSEASLPVAKRARKIPPVKRDVIAQAEGSSSTLGGKDRGKVKVKHFAQKMPKKPTGQPDRSGHQITAERTKKGDSAAKHIIDDPMDEDESHWDDTEDSHKTSVIHGDDRHDENDRFDESDDEDEDGPGLTAEGSGTTSAYDHLTRLAEGSLFNEVSAAALFGGEFEFRAFGGLATSLSARFKRLKADLRSGKSVTRLAALRECSDLLLVSNEDTLGASFSTSSFATEFIAILNGKPNIDQVAEDESMSDEDMDEDAQLAAALSMSTGGRLSGEEQEDMEAQLLACRCLAHLMEALPGSGHTLVHLGAVRALCSKLNEISYIELAEQTLSTMEKLSAEYPAAIVREGGLGALLNYLPFFSTNVQRTAVTAAANCCRNISGEHFEMVRSVLPILRAVLTQADQRLVEQATLALVRTVESYRHASELLEGLLDLPTVIAINALLMPSGGSPLISDTTYTHLLKALTSVARVSAKVTISLFEAGVTSTVHHILTGVLPSSHEEDEQGGSVAGQGLAGGVADMVVMQNLAHRPKDQVEEALSLICELLPPIPRHGVFDQRGYTEKSLERIRSGRRHVQPIRLEGRTTESASSTSNPGTPGEPSTIASISAMAPINSVVISHASIAKLKRDAEDLSEQRLALLKTKQELVAKFMHALVPVLVDVYAASVSIRVRTKALTGLVKAVAFAEPNDLQLTLTSVPMPSFLGSIISAKDSPAFVLHALQLVELLATKLPHVFLTSFLREGVVFEIDTLANEELRANESREINDTVVAKNEPGSSSAPVSIPSIAQVTSPLSPSHDGPSSDDVFKIAPPANELAASNSRLYDRGFLGSRKQNVGVDCSDANIIRARIIGAKNIFAVNGDRQSEAAFVLDQIGSLVKQLRVPEATEAELRVSLRDIAVQFSNVGQALSSFELLKSGLVDGLLDYVDISGTVSSKDRAAILYEIFSESALASPSPLTMLVKRLHESLGRLENFKVETAFNDGPGVGGTNSSPTRSLRIRLQAEDDDIPKQVQSLSVTIQAIAPVQALHDYLRPRVADPGYMSGATNLQTMFAAYAASRGSGSTSTSRLLAALVAGSNGRPEEMKARTLISSESRQPIADNIAASSAGTQSSDKGDKPQRRRSARLSGRVSTEEKVSEAESSSNAGLSIIGPEANILPDTPLDAEDYPDEDYEDDLFDSRLEEVMRPADKVVSMSMTSDGSRVEAKTPDGTRIATPNQVSARGMQSSTPRGSYAGAVKTAPVDWHLEFSAGGTILSLKDTIYGAVHKTAQSSDASFSSFNLPVTIKFRKVPGPTPSNSTDTSSSEPITAGILSPVLRPSTPVSKILRLLRVVHRLCVDGREFDSRSGAPEEALFVNNKLTAKLTRQLEETMILASNCLPDWAMELPKHFSFLFPFETRYSFLRSTSFGYGRLIAQWQSAQSRNGNNNRRDDNLAHLGRLVRQKVRISRAQILESCAKVLELYGTSSGILEVEYFDEIGTGLGPTLEFYSLVSKEFARRSLRMWRDDDESKEGSYVFHPTGLYPAPTVPEESSMHISGSRLFYFKTLGLFVGRALLDTRITDVNLNKIFLKLILGKPVMKSIATLKLVDRPLASSLERLQSYLDSRKEIEALVTLPASNRRSKLAALTIGGAKLHDLSLDFTVPGYDIELKPGGKFIDVDDSNLEEYLALVLDQTLGSGVAQQVKAFQDGFSMIFPVQDLQVFSPDELGLLFGNTEEDWSRDTLEQSIKADHGYNADSRTVRNLIELMTSYDKNERREFLQFITGAPKLPIGGFRGLNPPFTVVRKPHEPPFRADDYLPSVMTCAQYLKMPDYSSKEVLAAQMLRAIHDGGGSFHLS